MQAFKYRLRNVDAGFVYNHSWTGNAYLALSDSGPVLFSQQIHAGTRSEDLFPDEQFIQEEQ